MTRIHNFNAGPSAMPLEVLEEIQASFLNYKNCGMSITEISHRSKWFDEIIDNAQTRIKRLLKLDDNYKVLFIQGGASMQFALLPMNFLNEKNYADYVNTGTWSTKAIKEAEIQGKKINIVASSEDRNFSYIPKDINFSENPAFVHITSNNTIKGTQWHKTPDTGDSPIIADMSSDILSRPMPDIKKYGLIYAGAQKNIGPAGVAVVIIRDDMLDLVQNTIPTMMRYSSYAKKNSMFNTPPCFAIYYIQLVMTWLEETIGGLEKIDALNQQKAKLLYDILDQTGFYQGIADKKDRSLMNITFRLKDKTLEERFIKEALSNDLGGLKGHSSVGGFRASIYNATGLSSIKVLADFMKTFEKKNG